MTARAGESGSTHSPASDHEVDRPIEQSDRETEELQGIEKIIEGLEPSVVSRILFWGILGFFALLFLWAAFAEIDRTVRGQGRVISSSELQVVSTLGGGVVEDIFVRQGQSVSAGQELLRLDPTESEANLGSTSATATALEMKVARLRAEVSGGSPRFPAPADEEAARQREIERALFASRQANLVSATSAARASVASARQSVAEAERRADSLASAGRAARDEAEMLRPLVESGIEPRLSLVRAESQATSAEADYSGALAAIERARANVAEAEANLARTLQDWRSRAGDELAAAQAELGANEATLPALEERRERTAVRAPVAGTVNRVLVTTRGSAVGSGQELVEIAPSDDALLVEVRIRPQDIATVYIGQPAKVGITAFDQAVYGSFDGKVESISPDSIVDERDGGIYYLVRVRTQAEEIETTRGDLRIGTGMVADVSLLGDKRTVLEYILTPLNRFSSRVFRE